MAWIKLYKSKPYSRNTQVSYYLLGSLVSLYLDLNLRLNNSSLSELLRILWLKYGLKGVGYSRELIKCELHNLSPELSMELDRILDSKDDLDFQDLFKSVGLELVTEKSEEVYSGITFDNQDCRLVVSDIDFNSPFQSSGIIIGDELISIDNIRLYTQAIFNTTITKLRQFDLLFARDGFISKTPVLIDDIYIKSYTLKELEVTEDDSITYQKDWLTFY